MLRVRAATDHVFAEEPPHARVVVGRAVGQINQFAKQVGERLVDGTRLVVVEEVRRELRHAVRQLVPDDSSASEKPLP